MKHGFKVDELASVIHVYPTDSTVSVQASAAIMVKRCCQEAYRVRL